MVAAFHVIFLWISNCMLLSKSRNIGFLIEEPSSNMADNASISPGLCLTNLPETLDVQVVVRKYRQQNPEDLHYYVNELVSKDCLVVVTYVSCEMQELVQAYLTVHRVPHIPLPDMHCFRTTGNTRSSLVRMRSKTNSLMLAITSLISHLHWTETNILKDETFPSQQVMTLMTGLSKKMVRFNLHQLEKTKGNFESQLKRYKPRIATTCFLILMDRERTIQALKAASRLNLIRYNTQWIIGNFDLNDDDLQQIHVDPNEVNIVAFKQSCVTFLKKGPQHDKLAMTELELESLEMFLNYLSRCLSVFNIVKEFLERNSKQQKFHLIPSSQEMEIGTLKRFHILFKNDTVRHYDIVRVENIGDGSLGFRQVAQWSANHDKIMQYDDQFFLNSRPRFGNRLLKVGFNQMEPYISQIKDSHPPQYVGFNVDMLNHISLSLNFRYELIETPDGQFGMKNETSGEWSGVIGMTARNEVDLGVNPLTLNYKRFTVVDFTQPYTEDRLSILVKRPNGTQSDLLQIFRVFAESTWVALAVSFVISFVLLTLVNRGSSYLRGKDKVPKPTRSYKYNLWLMFSFSLQEGTAIEPVNTPGRIIVGFWWLFIILVTTNYTANLAAFLMVPNKPIEIRNLKDLANSDKLSPITIYDSDGYHFFQTSTNKALKQIGSKMKSGPHFTHDDPIISLVDAGDYAMVVDEWGAYYLASKRCGFYQVISDPAYKHSLGFVLPKGSLYKDMVSNSIVAMHETGLIEKLQKRWWKHNQSCLAPSKQNQINASGLKLNTIGGAFLVYTYVAILGVLCLIVELIVARIQKLRNTNQCQASSSSSFPASSSGAIYT